MKDTEQEDAEEQEEEKNPSIANPQWKNADGQSITKALVGDEVTLCADVQDIPDGTGAKIKIVEKDADGQDDDVATLNAKVQNGKIRCAWKVVYTEDDDDTNSQKELEEKGYTLPEYAFTVECGGAESGESGQLDVMGWINKQIISKYTNKPMKNLAYKLFTSDGKLVVEGKSDNFGYISVENIKIGRYKLCLGENNGF